VSFNAYDISGEGSAHNNAGEHKMHVYISKLRKRFEAMILVLRRSETVCA